MSEFFSSQEDELNILFDKLSKTISTFSTLSRELAEKAIIETNSKIKEGEEMIEKLEDFVKDNETNLNKDEILELNKKINNYKIEFNNLIHKFNQTQNTYINKKAENALIEDIEVSINNKKTDLIDDETSKKDENKKKFGKKNFNTHKSNSISNNINNMVFEKNIANISGVNSGNNNLPEEVFTAINNKSNKKRKKILCGVLVILSVVIITVIIYLTFFLPKNEKSSI